MRAIKELLGAICFAAALYLGLMACFQLNRLGRHYLDWPLSVCAFSLVGMGCFLIVQRNKAMTSKAKVRFFLICCLWIAFFIGVEIPNFVHTRSTSACNACINNLRQLDAAMNQFAFEKHKSTGDAIHFPDDLTPYLKLNSMGNFPACPDGGVYCISKVGDKPTCSFSNTINPAHVLP